MAIIIIMGQEDILVNIKHLSSKTYLLIILTIIFCIFRLIVKLKEQIYFIMKRVF